MAKTTWKVRLHLVNPDAGPQPKAKDTAKHTDTFGVEADGHDAARAAATAWLKDRKYTVRAMNFTPTPNEIIAYVLPLETAAAKN